MGGMMGNSFGGLGAPGGMMGGGMGGGMTGGMAGGMGSSFPGAMSSMANPQSAGMYGMGMGLAGANPFGMATSMGGMGGGQSMSMMGPPAFGNQMMGGQQGFNPALSMGGGMDMLSQQPQLSMPRMTSPSAMMAGPPMGGGFGMAGAGQNGMGLGMNSMMNSGGGGMGMGGFGGLQGAGLSMPGMSGGGMGFGGGGGYQQGLGGAQVVLPHPFLLLQSAAFNPLAQGAWGGNGGGGGGGFPPLSFGFPPYQNENADAPLIPIPQNRPNGFFQAFSPAIASWPPAPPIAALGNRPFMKRGMFFQFPAKEKRWAKSKMGDDEGRVSMSSVIDALKQSTINDDEENEIDTQETSSCGGCMPLDLRKITGYWTQVFGNPDSLRLTYTALSRIPSSSEPDEGSDQGPGPPGGTNRNESSVQPGCVGFHFERPFPRRVSDAILGEAPVNMHFRDDRNYRPYQISGMVQQSLIPNQSEIKLRISSVDIPLCLIKGGISPSGDYDYVIFMETRGPHRCKGLHVIARNSDLFFRNYSSGVIEFLQDKVKSGEIDTIKIMPNPEQCEPRQQQQQQEQDREEGG